MARHRRFVNKVIKDHKGNIKDFTLSGRHHSRYHREVDVIKWINAAISRGVERLHMGVNFPPGFFRWPLSVFSCKTLVDLNMGSLYKFSLDIPTTPIFPCLKKLEARYSDNIFFTHIVARCSALEHLTVYLNGSPIEIVSSSVKRLELNSGSFIPTGQKVVLCAPSLQYLNFHCVSPLEFIVEEQLSSLVEADIFFSDPPLCARNVDVKQICDSSERVIQAMSNVKVLRIRLYGTGFSNSIGPGLFVNLTKLEIDSADSEWRLLLDIMESSINLDSITLQKRYTFKKQTLAWKEPKRVPTCLTSSIRKITIDGYSEDELPMVEYVLRTAQVLEQVDIKCAISYRDDNNLKSAMLQNLQKLHKACERCEIVFA